MRWARIILCYQTMVPCVSTVVPTVKSQLGAKHTPFLRHFVLLKTTICEDRLGINIRTQGKVENEGVLCSAATAVWCLPGAWAHPLMGEGENHVARIPGGVRLAAVTRATVTDCSFQHMGGSGLDLYGGVQHSAVRGCFVSDISASGLQVGSASPCPHCPSCGGCRGAPCRVPPGAAAAASVTEPAGIGLGMSPPCPPIGDGKGTPFKRADLNITLEDNVVADVAVEYSGCVGFWGGVTAQLRFRYNEICRVPYSGLSLGWNWAIPTANTIQRGQEISYNRISYWLQSRLADGGATYMLGPQPNSTHHHNYIHDGGSGTEPGGSGHGSGAENATF